MSGAVVSVIGSVAGVASAVLAAVAYSLAGNWPAAYWAALAAAWAALAALWASTARTLRRNGSAVPRPPSLSDRVAELGGRDHPIHMKRRLP